MYVNCVLYVYTDGRQDDGTAVARARNRLPLLLLLPVLVLAGMPVSNDLAITALTLMSEPVFDPSDSTAGSPMPRPTSGRGNTGVIMNTFKATVRLCTPSNDG